MKLKPEEIYQFLLLFILTTINFFVIYKTGADNETITGALIGLAVGLPVGAIAQMNRRQ